MNNILISVFIFQISCCFIFSIAYLIFTDLKEEYLASYIIFSHEITMRIFIIKFFTFLVAYSHLIPISLYVAMEVVKILQSWFVFYDNIIYDFEYDKPSYARTSELIEELGQVEFIFSDKTGTLTVNKMDFKSCFIAGVVFGVMDEQKKREEKTTKIEEEIDYEDFVPLVKLDFSGDRRLTRILSNKNLAENNSENIIDEKFEDFDNLNIESLYNKFDVIPDTNISAVELKKRINNFFRVCILCHSAINEKDKTGKLIYASSSPDEIAFLQGAKRLGFVFSKRTTNTIEIINNYTRENEIWEILLEIPFDSDRQCMTMILKKKGNSDNKVYVMIKGADNKLLNMLSIEEVNLNSMNGIIIIFIF